MSKSTISTVIFTVIFITMLVIAATPTRAQSVPVGEFDPNQVTQTVSREEIIYSHIWVDPSAPAGGDGTQAHPLQRPPWNIATPTHIHLAQGVYENLDGFVVDAPLTIEGAGMGKTVVNGGISLNEYDAQNRFVVVKNLTVYQDDDPENYSSYSAVQVLNTTLFIEGVEAVGKTAISKGCANVRIWFWWQCGETSISNSLLRYEDYGVRTPPFGGMHCNATRINQVTMIRTTANPNAVGAAVCAFSVIENSVIDAGFRSVLQLTVLQHSQTKEIITSEVRDVLANAPYNYTDPTMNGVDPSTGYDWTLRPENLVQLPTLNGQFSDDKGRLTQHSVAFNANATVQDPNGTAGDWGAWGGATPLGQTVWAQMMRNGNGYNLYLDKVLPNSPVEITVLVNGEPEQTMTRQGSPVALDGLFTQSGLVIITAQIDYDQGQTSAQMIVCNEGCTQTFLPMVGNK
jgi:hypothetical protein